MKRRICLLLSLALILSVSINVFGQELDVIPPTPNAMKMTEYQTQRPNLYTGTASASVPLYTIDFDGWQLPLSLSYNATGIRTNEEATEVGLGWALNSTGVISRIVRGIDDLYEGGQNGINTGYVYYDTEISFDLGFEADCGPYNPASTTLFWKLIHQKPDTEPDIFNYNFFGYSGSFVLSKKLSPTDVIEVIKITQDATSISFDEINKEFTIVTPDGYKGEFPYKELSTSFSSSTSVSTGNFSATCGENLIDVTHHINNSGKHKVISSWYLGKITSPRKETIEFSYYLNADSTSSYLTNSLAYSERENYDIGSPTCLQNVQEHVYLSNITIPNELSIDFLMEDRLDIRRNDLFTPNSATPLFPYSSTPKRYNQINIQGLDPQSSFSKTIEIKQSYFNQQYKESDFYNENQTTWLRSRLDKVKMDDQEYSFDYLNGDSGIPNKQTASIDHFGFYNGVDMDWYDLFRPFVDDVSSCIIEDTETKYYSQQWNRRVVFDHGKAGLLSRVTYPTRGYAEYEYEAHEYIPTTDGFYLEQPGVKNAGGARIKSIKEYDFNNQIQRQRSFTYTLGTFANPLGSSGQLATPLVNGYKRELGGVEPCVPETFCRYLWASNTSIPGNNAAEGKILGYSVVHEVVTGATTSYVNSYYFENRSNEILPFNLGVSGFPNLNGEVTLVKNYDSNGNIVKSTENQNYEHYLTPVKGIHYRILGQTLNYWAGYEIKRSFHTPYTVVTTTADPTQPMVEDADGQITSYGNGIQVSQTSTYNDDYLLKTIETIDSENEILKTTYRRPSDYTTPSATLAHMKTAEINQVNAVIEEITEKNGNVIAASGKGYELVGDLTLLKSLYSYNRDIGVHAESADGLNFPSVYEKRTDYTIYDNTNGKLLEAELNDGTINSIIWGYNNQYPIVFGKGVTHQDLLTAHNAALASGDYENSIRNHALTSDAFITTFAHDPLVGMVSQVDPSGAKTTYSYDQYERLEKVLDRDDNVVAQTEYNFKQIPPTRITNFSTTSIDFGTYIYYDFYEGFIYGLANCKKDLTQTVRVTNDGTDVLVLNSISLPAGFTSPWNGSPISIPAGDYIDLIIEFDPASLGTYSGDIIIGSNKTSGPSVVSVSAIYDDAPCNFVLSQPSVDFGTVTDGFSQEFVHITNNGDVTLTLANVLIDNTNMQSGTHPEFSVGGMASIIDPEPFFCILPGETKTINVNYIITAEGVSDVDMTLDFWSCPDVIVPIQGERRDATSRISVDTTPIALGNFTEASKNFTVTVSNTGYQVPMDVQSLSFSDANAAQYFSTSPALPVTVAAGAQVDLDVTFQPTVFGQVQTDITINSNALEGTTPVIPFTGTRVSIRDISLSANPMWFDFQGQSQNVTITNIGNDNLSISGVDYPSTTDWSASVTPTTLAPNQSTTMSITNTGNASSEDLTISVLSNKNQGDNTVLVRRRKRVISLPASTLTFGSFTGNPASESISVSNTGNEDLSITSVTSSNSKFTVTPQTATITPGSSRSFTVQYTATDFTQQSTTLTFNSNSTSGSSTMTVNAQRTENYLMSVAPTSLSISPSSQTATSYVDNDGNVNATVTSITNTNSTGFSVQFFEFSGGIWVPVTLGHTLAPGERLRIDVTAANNFNSDTGTLTVFNDQSGSFTINLSKSSF